MAHSVSLHSGQDRSNENRLSEVTGRAPASQPAPIPGNYPRISASASSRSPHHTFIRLTVSFESSFVCWMATELFSGPFEVKNSSSDDPSSDQVTRIDFGRVCLRIVSFVPGSHFARIDGFEK